MRREPAGTGRRGSRSVAVLPGGRKDVGRGSPPQAGRTLGPVREGPDLHLPHGGCRGRRPDRRRPAGNRRMGEGLLQPRPGLRRPPRTQVPQADPGKVVIARLALSLFLLLPGGCLVLYIPDADRAATRGTI